MYVNYALMAHNSSGRRDIVADVIFLTVGDGEGDQVIFQRKTRFQRFAASFPLTKPIAQRQSQALFDLCAGFVYAQVLQACWRCSSTSSHFGQNSCSPAR